MPVTPSLQEWRQEDLDLLVRHCTQLVSPKFSEGLCFKGIR